MIAFVERKLTFGPWQVVSHRCSPGVQGIVTAFMQRGQNHSYEVQWGIEKVLWHLEEELLPVAETEPIGFNLTQAHEKNHTGCADDHPDTDHATGESVREDRSDSAGDAQPG
jgi:hypothetical protein